MKLSIIVPCRNEDRYLKYCLDSISDQDFPRSEYEIIVVDNGSTDRSLEIANSMADNVIIAKNKKVGAVRNIGAKCAQGDTIIFIDADCTIDNQWLSRAYKFSSENPTIVFGGGAALPEKANWIERYWLLEGDNGLALPTELIGCSIILSRSNFKNLQFNEQLSSGEDTRFSKELREKGINIVITHDLDVVHLGNAKTIKEFIERQSWHAQSYKKNKLKNITDPVFVTVIFFAAVSILSIVHILQYNKISNTLILLTLITPLTLTIKRYWRAKRRPNGIIELPISYFIDTLYIFGRIIGITKRNSDS